jgi:hypothetical protein
MKNKKTIVIATTSLVVLTILYFAIKKSNEKKFDTPNLQADYEEIMNKIDRAKT